MHKPKLAFQFTRALCFLLFIFISTSAQQDSNRRANIKAATNASGLILKNIPDKIDPQARYLFYLHGLIIENEGIRPTSSRFGVYEYEEILESFKNKGFVVISEARPKGTNPEQYAAKVAGQVRDLLQAGVPPRNITVVGASRGGGITMMASTLLKNRHVKFVIMAACGDYDIYERFGMIYGEKSFPSMTSRMTWQVPAQASSKNRREYRRRRKSCSNSASDMGYFIAPLMSGLI